MSLEQTIKDALINESVDLDMRLQQLVRSGLMPANTLPILRRAIAKVQGGYPLQGAERDVMATFINSMMFIVLGDDSIFNKARVDVKEEAEQIDERDEGKPGKNFAKIAAKAAKKYGSKEAGNRVAGAIRKKVLAKESRREEALADIAAITQMNESYRTTFNAALTQYGVKSPAELDEEKRKEFFNFVDQNYKKGDN